MLDLAGSGPVCGHPGFQCDSAIRDWADRDGLDQYAHIFSGAGGRSDALYPGAGG